MAEVALPLWIFFHLAVLLISKFQSIGEIGRRRGKLDNEGGSTRSIPSGDFLKMINLLTCIVGDRGDACWSPVRLRRHLQVDKGDHGHLHQKPQCTQEALQVHWYLRSRCSLLPPSLWRHSALLVACLGRAACLLSLLSCQGSPCPASAAVTCVIMQKKGAGFHEASSCYWDSANDRTSLSRSLSSLLLCRC